MPSAVSPQRRAASDGPDELDNLLDYDNAVEDFLRDIPMGDDNQQPNTTTEQPRDEDQEVQVKRKRKPVPKLDENRLLSDAGIPRLRKITKTRLKFRGKGHEFSDISRLLNTYQLWLDDLYPRAKFRDALTMVEKVGHSKRMQVMRKAWLDDTKPYRRETSPGLDAAGGSNNENAVDGQPIGSAENPDQAQDSVPDELDDLFAEQQVTSTEPASAAQQKQNLPYEEDDQPDDDELDGLLAENESGNNAKEIRKPSQHGPFEEEDPDEDELDALMADQHPENLGSDRTDGPRTRADENGIDFADDEEALASMGW